MTRLRPLWCLLAVCAAAVSCGNSTSEPAQSASTVVEVAAPETVATATETAVVQSPGPEPITEAATPSEEVAVTSESVAELISQSPIDLALGVISDPQALSDAYGKAYQDHADRVTVCMRDQGFNFTQRAQTTPAPEDFAVGQYNTESETLVDVGYGAVFSLQATVDQRLGISSAGAPSSGFAAATAGMSELEVDAFWNARGACMDASADLAVFPDDITELVFSEIEAFRSSLSGHEVIRDLWNAWSRCMSEEGYDFENRQAAAELVAQEAAPLAVELSSFVPTEELRLPLGFEQRVDDVRAVEERVLSADLNCAEQLSLDEKIAAYIFDQETAFVNQNGDRLRNLAGS